jgi:acetyl-CoA acetyltransferase
VPRFPTVATPAQAFSFQARRHMYEFGTTIDHFAEVAINARLNAATNPLARFRDPITVEDHNNSRLIADPIRLLDCCMESDGGACVIVTTAERAKDLANPPALIAGVAMGAPRRWGAGTFGGYNMSATDFTSAGQNTIADDLYRNADIEPQDVDVAEIYDHFTPMVLLGLEDFRLAPKGESGPFVADGNIRRTGSMPVNTHGGNLAEVYLHGMTHVIEATKQMRGTAINQIADAEVALVVCGASPSPSGALLLRKA